MVKHLFHMIGITFTLSNIIGCVTLPQDDFFNYQSSLDETKTLCIDIELYTYDNSFSINRTEPSKESNIEHSKFKKEINKYNIASDCQEPLRKYKLLTDLKINYPLLKVPWMILSTISLGIIPYYDTHFYQITLLDENRIVVTQDIPIKKAIWIFYLGKAYSLERKSHELYGTTLDRAIFSKQVAEYIRNDVNNK